MSAGGLPRDASGERGSGTVLGIAVIGATLAVLGLSVPLYIGVVGRESLAGAADAAALAAADVASGIAPGSPCSAADAVARANDTELSGCDVDGLVVTVAATRSIFGIPLRGTATAGPPAGLPAGE